MTVKRKSSPTQAAAPPKGEIEAGLGQLGVDEKLGHLEAKGAFVVSDRSARHGRGVTGRFQAMLAFRDQEAGPRGLPGVRCELLPSRQESAKFDLLLSLERGPTGLSGDLEYSAELFDPATAERLLGHFSRLLEAAVDDPARPLHELEVAVAAQPERLARFLRVEVAAEVHRPGAADALKYG